MVESPLNYTGGKSKLLSQILPLFPEKIDTFVDLFCGGCNVGLNVNAVNVKYNDYNQEVINLYKVLLKWDDKDILNFVMDVINEYNLSLVSQNGYEYYNCNSSEGLGKYNKEPYLKLRDNYNKLSGSEAKDLLLYVLVVYAFNNQIRFNSKGEFNLPVGKRDFNKKMEAKLLGFMNKVKKQSCTFECEDFRKFTFNNLNKNDFVYADPPYLITCASYNENGGWNNNDEMALLDILCNLDNKGIKFALSNVLKNKGNENKILLKWLKDNKKFRTIHLTNDYSNCNYHSKNRYGICDEVLIVNY